MTIRETEAFRKAFELFSKEDKRTIAEESAYARGWKDALYSSHKPHNKILEDQPNRE